MNIVELFARIGLKTDEEKAKSFEWSMKAVKKSLIATSIAATGTAIAIRKITRDAVNASAAFKQFETETGASAQELQKWQAVAEQTNQSAESVSSAIKAIVSNQEKIRLGQGNISGFQLLGIDPRQDPFKILEQLRDKTDGVTQGMKKNLLAQLGIGAGLMQTLDMTRKQFDEMAGRAWIISPEAIETLNQTKSAMDLAGRAVNYMKTQIAVGLSPQIKKITKDFQEWMKVNEKGIIEGFKLGFKYVTMFVKAGYNAGTMIDRLVSSTVGWDYAVKGVIGVILLLNRALLLSPIGLITAGIILLVAVLDDLQTYSQGGKSLFGNMMEEFPELEKTLFGSFKVIKDVFELMKAFASGDASGIKAITENWGTFGEIVDGIYQTFKDIKALKLGDLFAAYATGDTKKLKELTKEWGLLGDIIGKIADGIEVIQEFTKSSGIDEFVKKDKEQLARARQIVVDKGGLNLEMPKLLQTLIDKISGGSNQTNNITQNINGSGDPVLTGRESAKALQAELKAASAQLARDQ